MSDIARDERKEDEPKSSVLDELPPDLMRYIALFFYISRISHHTFFFLIGKFAYSFR